MRAFISIIGLLLWIAGAFAASAQEASRSASLSDVRSPVLVLDYDALFSQSEFGRRVSDEIQRDGRDLVEENERIEAELTAEELLLTSQRDTMSADAFRALADEFDRKVQRLRSEQDAKARNVGQDREGEEQRFRSLVTPVIAGIMQETGAAVVIDRNQAIVWAEVVDITQIVLERVNATIGTGLNAPAAPTTADSPGTAATED
ncbi:OmpH family outer membrane protein [Roseobacteraceae bacterium S113]